VIDCLESADAELVRTNTDRVPPREVDLGSGDRCARLQWIRTTAMTAIDIERRAVEMEAWPPERILAWAARAVPRVSFSTGFGAEGCALVHMIASARLPIDIFTLDTGLLFPETYELWAALERKYHITIRAVKPKQTVEEQAATSGPGLWERDPERCCGFRKLEPLQDALRGVNLWLTGIRREQTPERAAARVVERDARYGVIKVNPVVRWTSKDVWRFLHAHDVPYNVLHNVGYPSIGCQPCTTPVVEGEDPRAGRWRGHARNECGLHVTARPLELKLRVI
jgi:phosphoadenosine phosphosulfate reductase